MLTCSDSSDSDVLSCEVSFCKHYDASARITGNCTNIWQFSFTISLSDSDVLLDDVSFGRHYDACPKITGKIIKHCQRAQRARHSAIYECLFNWWDILVSHANYLIKKRARAARPTGQNLRFVTHFTGELIKYSLFTGNVYINKAFSFNSRAFWAIIAHFKSKASEINRKQTHANACKRNVTTINVCKWQ